MSEISREWLVAIGGILGTLLTVAGGWALKAIGVVGNERRADYHLFFDEIKAVRLEMDRRDERYKTDLRALEKEHESCRLENAEQKSTIAALQLENRSQAARITDLESQVRSLRAEARSNAIPVNKDNQAV